MRRFSRGQQKSGIDGVPGRELTKGGEKSRGRVGSAAKCRELCAWKEFGVFKLLEPGGPPKYAADTRWVLSCEAAAAAAREGGRT